MDRLDSVLHRILAVNDVEGVALVDRRGQTLAAAFSRDVNEATFGVMCASMIDAAVNAADEFGKPPPTRIDVQTPAGSLVLCPVGTAALLVVILGTWPPAALSSEIELAAAALRLEIPERLLVE